MSKLLDIEKRLAENRRPGSVELPVTRDKLDFLLERNKVPENSIRPVRRVRYLPIVGEVVRDESGIGLPLLPVTLEGVYHNRRRLRVDERIFERRTDGRGRFLLLVQYKPDDEKYMKDAEVHLAVAGQDEIFRIPILDYIRHGKAEMEDMLGSRKFKSAFHQMGINESQVIGRKQLSLISIGSINIQ